MISKTTQDILGVILAGGLSRRMRTSDKFFLEYQGKSLLEHTISRAEPQVDRLIITANGDTSRFNHLKLTTITDDTKEPCGPIAGVISAMKWAKHNAPHYKWLMSFPSDTPNFPVNCVEQLKNIAVLNDLDAAVACSEGQNHYAFSLWSMNLLEALEANLAQGQRAMHSHIKRGKHELIEFNDNQSAFFNVNTPEQWQQLIKNQVPNTK